MTDAPDTSAATGDERDAWQNVKDIIGNESVTLGHHWSFNLRNDPKRLPFVLARYKFAAKMACGGGDVLELGCSEGIGTPILAEHVDRYFGVDMDGDAIATAQKNWGSENVRFEAGDFLGKTYGFTGVDENGSGTSDKNRAGRGTFSGIVSLDVIEHISTDIEDQYFDTIAANLTAQGVAVVGTPNITSDQYASPMSKAGHINLFDAERLVLAMQRVFHNVMQFGMNDELLHTGYAPMAHYLICVGCNKK
jgi:2-polyprenyl-3-methyl-5-hydroxy-6-metoxy-1,4-benzoquinol methylase